MRVILAVFVDCGRLVIMQAFSLSSLPSHSMQPSQKVQGLNNPLSGARRSRGASQSNKTHASAGSNAPEPGRGLQSVSDCDPLHASMA
mmetsp:Transcript_60147/g.186625  ORF Transcript_60147/g.186625 Transcript_60147/m.186625 type:complete len:88 (-) Transcript_60147:109-372(-)